MSSTGPDLDAVAGRVVARLLQQAHLVGPEEIAACVAAAARPLGVTGARIYLADLQQRNLRPVPAGPAGPRVLAVDGTLAGLAYRTVTICYAAADGGAGGAGWQAWLPLIGATERLGVLELDCAEVSEPMLARYRTIASVTGLVVASKTLFSDTLAAAGEPGRWRSRPSWSGASWCRARSRPSGSWSRPCWSRPTRSAATPSITR